MLQNKIFYVNIIFCMSLNKIISIKKDVINSFITEDSFLNYYCPKMFNFNTEYSSEDIIIHLKNIILKTTTEDLIYAVLREDQSNQQLLLIKIKQIKKDLYITILDKHHLNDTITIYNQIEKILFCFFCKNLEKILRSLKNNNLKKNMLCSIVDDCNVLISKLHSKKRYLMHSLKLNPNIDTMQIKLFDETSGVLQSEKIKIQTKLYINEIVTKQCIQFFKKHEIKIKLDQEIMLKDHQIILIKSQNNYNLKILLYLEKILTQKFDFNSKKFDLEIQEKICQIYILMNTILKLEIFEFDMSYLLIIFLYYDYLINQVNILTKNENKVLPIQITVCSKLELHKYKEIRQILKNEKRIISMITKRISLEYFNKVKVKTGYTKLHAQNNLFFLLIELDSIYNMLISMFFSNKNDTQEFGNVSIRLLDFVRIIEKNLILLDFNTMDYVCQLSYCLFVLRIFSIYSFLSKDIQKSFKNNASNIINSLIYQINIILNNLEKNDENTRKMQFFEEILRKYTLNLYSIINNQCFDFKNSFKMEINQFFYEEWVFETKLFEKINEMCSVSNSILNKNILTKVKDELITTLHKYVNRTKTSTTLQLE